MKNNIQKFFVLVFISLLFVPLIADANILVDFVLDNMGESMKNGILVAASYIFSGFVTVIPNAALDFLNWVISPDFLKISMTNSGLVDGDARYNAIVGIGWGVTRNLANIALIFGLVLIAINIIIGNQEVQAKKALINFILIAILINFTPVICGVIIDASNSLTSYFMGEGVSNSLVDFLATSMVENKNVDFIALIVFFFFGIASALLYFGYAILFAARYIILWILIILSPIAFASKVFPKSRYIIKFFPSFFYWDEWWDQFIQWNVIGFIAGLFIYLSNVAMVTLTAQGVFADSSGISIFGRLFVYIMPFLFNVIGFFTVMSSGGPVGAKISGAVKSIGNKAQTAIVAGGTGAALGFASGAKAGHESGAKLGTLRGAFKGAAQGTLTGGESEKAQIKRWVQRNVKEPLGTRPKGTTTAEEKKEIEDITGKLKNLGTDDLQRTAQQIGTTEKNHKEKIAAIVALIDKGENIRPEEITWIMNNRSSLQRRGADLNKIAEYAPELSPQITGREIGQTTNGMSNKKFQESVRAESFSRPELLAHSSQGQLKKTIDDGSPNQTTNLRTLVDINNANSVTEIRRYYNQLTTERNNAIAQNNTQRAAEINRTMQQLIDNVAYVQNYNP